MSDFNGGLTSEQVARLRRAVLPTTTLGRGFLAVVAELLADAWIEGYDAADDYHEQHRFCQTGCTPTLAVNPYRPS